MRVVKVVYHVEGDGSWWAESPDVPGFTAVGQSLAEVRELVQSGVPFYVEDEVELREVRADGAAVTAVTVATGPWMDSAWHSMRVGNGGRGSAATSGARDVRMSGGSVRPRRAAEPVS